MRTYPLYNDQGKLVAFEVSSLLSRRLARRVAASIPGARIVSSKLREDQFCEFEIAGAKFAIEEPFGDNSRFWVGPVNELAIDAVERVQTHFANNRSGIWAVRLSVVICCVLIALALYQPVRRFVQQDYCLDNGGRWNQAASKCDGARHGG